jgi:hypothetical protein
MLSGKWVGANFRENSLRQHGNDRFSGFFDYAARARRLRSELQVWEGVEPTRCKKREGWGFYDLFSLDKVAKEGYPSLSPDRVEHRRELLA